MSFVEVFEVGTDILRGFELVLGEGVDELFGHGSLGLSGSNSDRNPKSGVRTSSGQSTISLSRTRSSASDSRCLL
jgi:hypothetical protein